MKDLNWLKWIKHGPNSFCSGCQYGIILRLLAYALEKAGFEPEQVAGAAGIGCAGWIISRYLNIDNIHTTHGRPIAVAIGLKRARPDLKLIVVSGDGDLADIGLNHLEHAAERNENISVFCVNNHCYGMTGGQACITTPQGIITPTTPLGKPRPPTDLVKKMLAADCSLVSRYPALPLGKSPFKTIDAVIKTLRYNGFSFFEFISPCVTHFCRKNGLLDAKALKKYLVDLKLPYGTFENLNDYQRTIKEGGQQCKK